MDSVTLNSVAVSHVSDQPDDDLVASSGLPPRSSVPNSPGFSFMSEPLYVGLDPPASRPPEVLVAASPVQLSPVSGSPPAVAEPPSSPAPDFGPLPPLVLASAPGPAVPQPASPVASGPSLLEVAYQAALSDTAPVSVSNAVARGYFDAALVPPLRESQLPARFTLKKTNILLTSFFMLFANLSGFSMFPLRTEVLGEVLELLSVVNDAETRFGLKRRFRSLWFRHFQNVPVDAVQRHRALFRMRSRPVEGFRLNSVGLTYRAPPGL